jgi:hypothetical protein
MARRRVWPGTARIIAITAGIGQLGDGTSTPSLVPTAVSSFP